MGFLANRCIAARHLAKSSNSVAFCQAALHVAPISNCHIDKQLRHRRCQRQSRLQALVPASIVRDMQNALRHQLSTTRPSAAMHRKQALQRRPAHTHRSSAAAAGRSLRLSVVAERKEYYDYKDMPPLPLTVKSITIPKMEYVVVDKASEPMRLASLAIFYDIGQDEQYGSSLNRKSAITALCMYDQEDVEMARSRPGEFPNIDLLLDVYARGLELPFVIDEITPGRG